MYLHRKLEDSELIDLLATHTTRLTQIMKSGESYNGEYDTCRRTIELIQNDVLARRGFYLNGLDPWNGRLTRQDSAA